MSTSTACWSPGGTISLPQAFLIPFYCASEITGLDTSVSLSVLSFCAVRHHKTKKGRREGCKKDAKEVGEERGEKMGGEKREGRKWERRAREASGHTQ